MTDETSVEQSALRSEVIRFAATLSDDLARRDHAGTGEDGGWRRDWLRIAEFGLLASHVPSEWGGQGRPLETTVAMLEALGEGCPDNGLTLAVNGHVWTVIEPILCFGTDEQKQRWLPGLADGSLVGADGVTEVASGSDAMALATTARRENDGYVLNGEKTLVGLAPDCDLALVYATVDPGLGRWGVTAFLVSADDPGFERAPAQIRMGLRSVPSGAMRFRDCWIPEERRLGDEGDGTAIFQHASEFERCFIFTSHVGSMARQLRDCAEFANARQVFGQPIDTFQSVSNRLADMRVRLETSRLMLRKAVSLKERGRPCGLHASMTKLHISEAFVASSMDALRIRGGAGYLAGSVTERDLRDALGGVIYGGTSDIQRQIISTLLRPSG